MIAKKQKEKTAPGERDPLALAYNRFVQAQTIKDDPAQRAVLQALQRLATRLHTPPHRPLRRLFGKTQPQEQPKGLYIWGDVGRGKSMLMDLFFDHVDVAKKRRVHFHAFMQEVHARIHQFRQDGARGKSGADPVVLLYQQIANETRLLCFDELQATDVADATLLHRLFSGLFEAGVVIVSTSNHPPASLYTGGIQKERFDKFIALIEEQMNVAALSSPKDYRYLQTHSAELRYYYPLGVGADAFVDAALQRLCRNTHPQKGTLHVHGRAIAFQRYDENVGRFTFADLCQAALGPADYLAIATRLRTLILTGIPQLGPEKRNEAKRFVTLIDALYEHKVQLLATAEVAPEAIYSDGDGAFEFKRTVSRLLEMQSSEWERHANAP